MTDTQYGLLKEYRDAISLEHWDLYIAVAVVWLMQIAILAAILHQHGTAEPIPDRVWNILSLPALVLITRPLWKGLLDVAISRICSRIGVMIR